MRQLALFLLLIFTFNQGYCQTYQKKNIDFEGLDLLPPVKIPMILAGNFGEMRSNHFHTGLDIKTQGVEGKGLYAIEDGVVSRVRVGAWGYGLAVYIDHPKIGLTTVYGHMKSFSPKIDSLVYSIQKEQESWSIDEIVLDKKVTVKRGEEIGLSGNSGSSSAPHLHFEVRETSTEHALNPLLFKCYRKKISDHRDPDLKGLKIYAVSNRGYMIPGKSQYFYIRSANGKLEVNNGQAIDIASIITQNANLGFGFHITDKLDAAYNVCGIHHTTLNKGAQLLHEQQIDYIDFSANRFLNSHQDYFEADQNRRHIHKHFTTVINPLEIYPKAGGLVPFEKAEGRYNFMGEDVHDNAVRLSFEITNSSDKMAENPFDVNAKDYFFPDSVNVLLYDGFQVLLEPGTFYEPLQKIFKIDSTDQYLSPQYQFMESQIPVQKNFDVRINAKHLPNDFPVHKLGIGVISENGYLSFKGGDYVDGWVESDSRDFGTFVLVADTIPPSIEPLDFYENKDISRYRTLELKIEDNLSGVWRYRAYINGEWVLMYYHRRKSKYVIPLDERSKPLLKEGENKIKIHAHDGKWNVHEKVWTVNY